MRNPLWRASDAANVLTLVNAGATTVAYAPSTSISFENTGVAVGSLSLITYVRVVLRADATYQFVASGSYQVDIELFDAQGYMLISTDGDDIGVFDKYPTDSIANFHPDGTGVYYLGIHWEYLDRADGVYAIAVAEDIGSDGRNSGSTLPPPPTTPVPDQAMEAAYRYIMRNQATDINDEAFLTNLRNLRGTGKISYGDAVDSIVQHADASTSVATLAYQFFTGKIPTQAGVDYLVSVHGGNANNLNSDYYQSFNLENRYINFSVNLGKLGAGAERFASNYGGLTLFDASRKAYATIFGVTPTDAKLHQLIDSRADYFAYYGQDGANGIGTKAAMVGWLLAEAVKADVGTYATANDAFLHDLANDAVFAVDLVGVYKGVPIGP